MTAAADRHLLLGLLALQNGLISQGQLVAAFQAWTLEKSQSLASHLEARGDLTGTRRALLEALAEVHLDAHGGDVQKSLAAVSAGESTKEHLARLGDPDIDATLDHVGPAHGTTADGEYDRTSSYAVGSATSDGLRFRVLRPHARGGLGAVFVALDNELKREVALKQILDHHADDPTSRQRFLIEAEVTGGLEHPGIVPVYGLGSYGDGRPFYAMRFIKGDSLKEALEQFHSDEGLKADPGRRSLELRKLLRRFHDVCNAIDYAHSRGVLHRDIKPGNIIVGKHGETLVVDWGLAKPVGRVEPESDLGERMLVPSSASGNAETLPGSAIGTPAYMSPEQACGDLDKLGPRSDVYSLGSTLYCLLTGRPPFGGDDIGEVLRRVQRSDFAPPRQLDPSIDRALEAVCLKAMALSPEDRYATPRALADDLERWMADEPVSAWREPWSRSMLRWLTRHRTGVTAMGAALVMALAGLAAVLGVQTQANAQLTAKNIQLAASVKREAERFNLAMDAIQLFHGDVSTDLLLKEKGFEKLRTKLLRGAADFYGKLNRLLAGQGDDASRAALGKAYAELGKLTGDIGTKSDALAVHEKALAVRREQIQRTPGSAEAALDLARTLIDIGNLQRETRELASAMEPLKEAQKLAEDVEASGQGSDAGRYVLARALYGQGVKLMDSSEPANATGLFDRSTAILQALFDANPDNQEFQWGLASALDGQAHLMSDPARSLAVYRRELLIREKLAAANPDGSGYQNALAITHNNIAGRLEALGRLSESVVSARRAVEIWQAAADAYPAITSIQANVSFGHFGLGQALWNLGRLDEALAALVRAKVILQRLIALDPTLTPFKRGVASILGRIGSIMQQTGHPDRALAEFDQELLVRNELATPGDARAQNLLATCEVNRASALLALGRTAEARTSCDRAMAIREDRFKANPTDVDNRSGLAASLLRSGQVKRAAGDAAGAAADWRRAVALYKGLPPRSGGAAVLEAGCHAMLSGIADIAGSGVTAAIGAREAERAMEILRGLAATTYRDQGPRTEPSLDPLRARPDFQLLMMDVAFPADPFAD